MANLIPDKNPLEVLISNVTIIKFDGKDEQSLMPQFVELTLYQSIFEPVMKAEMLINDNIGLFVNYPFTGEEIITVTYSQNSDVLATDSNLTKLQFIIRGVRSVAMSDRARSLMFIVDLTSVEFLQNTRKNVSHAFNDRVENMAETVYDEYIKNDTQEQFGQKTKFKCNPKPFNKEKSLKIRSLIVPNLRPFQAIQWLAKHAVSENSDTNFLYLFYEDNEAFNFVTIQKLIKDTRDLYKDYKNNKDNRPKTYKYVSDIEQGMKLSKDDSDDILYQITNIANNKRFSSIEKIAGGYYQNELFEISLLQKSFESTVKEISSNRGTNHLADNLLNTEPYINYVKNKKVGTEYSNRIRYIVNNYEDLSEQNKTQPANRLKFGEATRYTYALNQIDYTITVPANMKLKAGQVIYCELPEMHGFNDVQTDQYISGFFIITEVKQVLGLGNRAATSLRLNKDGYDTKLEDASKYGNAEQ
jgi:hypothetical protein